MPAAVVAYDKQGAGREQQHDARREQPLPGLLDMTQRVADLLDATRAPHAVVAEQRAEDRRTEQHHAHQVGEHQDIMDHRGDSGTRAADILDGAAGLHSAAWKGASSGSTAAGADGGATADTRCANSLSNAASGDSGAAAAVDGRTPLPSSRDGSAWVGAATPAETAVRRAAANRAFFMMVPRESLEKCGFGAPLRPRPRSERYDPGTNGSLTDSRRQMQSRVQPDANAMPFDGKRSIYGGFQVIVDA